MALLTALMGLAGLPGCLLSPPADYEGEARIPPRLLVLGDQTEPEPYVFHERLPGESIDFRIRVQSNDVAADSESPLVVVLFRNFNGYRDGRSEDKLDFKFVPAATLDDGPRLISVNYTLADEVDGCYQYTLFVTPLDNGTPPDDVSRREDVALVTWWVNVETDDEPNDVRDCLTKGQQ